MSNQKMHVYIYISLFLAPISKLPKLHCLELQSLAEATIWIVAKSAAYSNPRQLKEQAIGYFQAGRVVSGKLETRHSLSFKR